MDDGRPAVFGGNIPGVLVQHPIRYFYFTDPSRLYNVNVLPARGKCAIGRASPPPHPPADSRASRYAFWATDEEALLMLWERRAMRG